MTSPLHPTADPPAADRTRLAVVEICVDDVEGAVSAEAEGADRVELCAALSEGGLTPSLGLARTVLDRVRRIGVQIMIRPRGGDFIVGDTDLDVMLADIAALRRLGRAPGVVVGFVFGALTPARTLDVPVLAQLAAACAGAPTTLHKAFDATPNLPAALEAAAGLGLDRILTSGGCATAEAGAEALHALVRQAGPRIAIVAGGGVRAHNVRALIGRTGVGEVHLRAMREHPGRPPLTSPAEIAAVLHAVRAR